MIDKYRSTTRLVHAGRPGHAGPVNPPVVRASTILFPDTATLREAYGSRRSYGRLATDTTLALEEALCAAEGAAGCMLTPSGLAAISLTLLALLSPGDHLLMVDSVYEPSRIFCEGLLKRMGVETTYYDPLLGAGIAALLRPTTRVVFVESPGSLSFEVQDVPAIAAIARRHGIAVVADSTWATPLGWAAFEHGVDVSIHAATKYIVGHSDVMMGAVLCTDALLPRLRRAHREMGLTVGGDDAYLALRGFRTLGARLAQHGPSAMAVAQWLQAQPEVEQVLYPPMPGSPGHTLWQRDFRPGFACGLMGVLLRPNVPAEAADALVDATSLFGIGFSWGGYESLILPVAPGKLRMATTERWKDRTMLRLHVGLEDVSDLIADLERGFTALRQAAGA